MSKLYIPVGIPGCGKSHLAEQMVAAGVIPPEAVVSSDKLRKILTGDESCMDVHMEAFGIAHTIARTRLGHGQDVYFDATNLLAKDLKQVIGLAPDLDDVELIISDTPDSVSLERNARRARVVPDAAMQKFIQRQKSFNLIDLLVEFPVGTILLSSKLEQVSDVLFDQLFPPDLEPLPEPLQSVLTGDRAAEAPIPQTDPTEP